MPMNPFDISFGKAPHESIARLRQSHEITDSFSSSVITQQVILLTGVRGSGKTVLMNTIANNLEKRPEWIVARLNPERDLLQLLGARLCSIPECVDLFRRAKLNLSLFGIGVEVDSAPPVNDVEILNEQMLKALKAHGKRVLVTIDEASNTPQMRSFCSAFQIYIGQELPVFLLMTGLFENIDALRNEKSLTFLYRAPRIMMEPLNLGTIAERYKNIFSLTEERAMELAGLTKGFPFAFQALGYSRWEHRDDPDAEMMQEYRQLLDEYVYEKVWSELSAKDKLIVRGLAESPDGRVRSVNEYLQLKPDEINQYRRRLIRKGIIDGTEYGRMYFTLPLFDQFVRRQSV